MSHERLLPHIPSPLLVAAGKTLPDAEICTDPHMDVQVLVTIRYERMTSKRGKMSRSFWTAAEAEVRVEGEDGWEILKRSKGVSGTGSFLNK